jgi:deoxyribodipyrimidine photo-lyase
MAGGQGPPRHLTPSIVWFRQDLRIADQAALTAAAGEGPVVAAYVFDDKTVSAAQHWWLHHSLTALSAALAERGCTLVLRRGDAAAEIARLAADVGTRRAHAVRHYEPHWQKAEAAVAQHLDLVLHDGNHLTRPAALLTGSGGRYRVFTPWWRALLQQMPPPTPLPAPERINSVAGIATDKLADWNLLPTKPDWATGFTDWKPGEAGARDALRAFLPEVTAYDETRNLPSQAGSSRLSPHLHFGEISPATVWHHAAKAVASGAEPFLREIGWRDYATNLIDQFPDYATRNGRAPYDKLPWRSGAEVDADFAAWTKGRTGYPIVDAGMRQLWATGWMHNRVRMIAASFLIKHLLIDWRRGEGWFRETLLDYDAASNAANWQWVAGTGVDAPLFSRIMAPLSQSEKFGAGDYIRHWVPELAGVHDPYVHDPEEFGARPSGYPAKLIGHRAARERALAALATIRG